MLEKIEVNYHLKDSTAKTAVTEFIHMYTIEIVIMVKMILLSFSAHKLLFLCPYWFINNNKI